MFVAFGEGIVWIKWIGTQKAYDMIAVREVNRGG